MGNEIFYCTECGVRANGSDFAPGTSGFGAERSCCPACLGLPVVSRRESSKRIRAVAVAARPRTIETPPPKRSVAPLLGATLLVAAGAVAFLIPKPTSTREPVAAPAASAPVLPPRPPEARDLPCGFALNLARTAHANRELEALAETAYGEIEEAALALADEGRVTDALARIETFPAAYRSTRAGVLFEKLRLRLQERAR